MRVLKLKRLTRGLTSTKVTVSILVLLAALALALPIMANAETGLEMPPGFSETSPMDAFSPDMPIPSDIATDTTVGWAYSDIVVT